MVVFLLLVGIVLFSMHAGKEPRSTPLGSLMLEVVGPVQSLVSSVGDGVESVWRRYFALVGAAKQNEDLRRQVNRLKRELSRQEELKLANQRLRKLVGLKDRLAWPLVAAEVVAVDPTDYFRTSVINAGSSDGVRKLMPVVNDLGVVGRVVWTSPNYAKLLLLTDPNAAVDVIVERSRVRGVVEGAGRDALRLKYALHNDDVMLGDRLICSGAAGVFPKGYLVGTVSSVTKEAKGVFQAVNVEPAVNFARLEEVIVILRQRQPELQAPVD